MYGVWIHRAKEDQSCKVTDAQARIGGTVFPRLIVETTGGVVSWEYSKYEAQCQSCGRIGLCIQGSDDWGRSSTTGSGFENREPDPMDVDRKRADKRDLSAVCSCGSSAVVIGKYLGDC